MTMGDLEAGLGGTEGQSELASMLGLGPEKVEDGRVRDGSQIKSKSGSDKTSDSGVWELRKGLAVELPVRMPLKYAIGLLAMKTREAAEKGEIPKTKTHPIEPGDTIDPYVVSDGSNYPFPFLLYEQTSLLLAKFLIPPGMERDFQSQYDPISKKTYARQTLPLTVGDLAGVSRDEQSNGRMIELQVVNHFKGNPYEPSGAERPKEATDTQIDPEWAGLFDAIHDSLGEADGVIMSVVKTRPTGILRRGFEEDPAYGLNQPSVPAMDYVVGEGRRTDKEERHSGRIKF